MLTQEILKEHLYYDPETGVFTWLKSQYRPYSIGTRAGKIHARSGYERIGLLQKVYSSHRLAWMYVHGYFPEGEVDHINGYRSDNRINNLRTTDDTGTATNKCIACNNKSGFKGVDFYSRYQKWRARCQVSYGSTLLGYFDTPEEASEAYQAFARGHHKEFYRDTTSKKIPLTSNLTQANMHPYANL